MSKIFVDTSPEYRIDVYRMLATSGREKHEFVISTQTPPSLAHIPNDNYIDVSGTSHRLSICVGDPLSLPFQQF